ncbi:hypothetical protein VB005_01131 [Metarhizium brunneum]
MPDKYEVSSEGIGACDEVIMAGVHDADQRQDDKAAKVERYPRTA